MIKVADKAKVEVTKLMKDDGYNPSSDFVRVGVKVVAVLGFLMILNLIKYVQILIRFLSIMVLK